MSESSQHWLSLSESIVTPPSVKPRAGADCWKQNLRLKTSLRFVTGRFANLSDLDEISQLGWHSTFCLIVIFSISWHLTFRKYFSEHSNLNLAPLKRCAPAQMSPLPL